MAVPFEDTTGPQAPSDYLRASQTLRLLWNAARQQSSPLAQQPLPIIDYQQPITHHGADAQTRPVTKNAREIAFRNWVVSALANNKATNAPSYVPANVAANPGGVAGRIALHELAHAFQSPEVWGNAGTREPAAELFSLLTAPKALPAAGLPGALQYAKKPLAYERLVAALASRHPTSAFLAGQFVDQRSKTNG